MRAHTHDVHIDVDHTHQAASYPCKDIACNTERKIGHQRVGQKQLLITRGTGERATGCKQRSMDCLLSAEENAARLGTLMRWELINRTEVRW